jgi:hypothetical protein
MGYRTLAVLVLLTGVSVGQDAKFSQAGYLVDLCESKNISEIGLCAGIIHGWRNVIDALPVFTPDKSARLLIDPTATDGQLERVFVKYVKDAPETENKDAFLVFSQALKSKSLMVEDKNMAKGGR